MSLSNILQSIKQLMNVAWPGFNTGGGTYNYGSLIGDYVEFIQSHSLILFFVLCSLIGVGITVIRRLVK